MGYSFVSSLVSVSEIPSAARDPYRYVNLKFQRFASIASVWRYSAINSLPNLTCSCTSEFCSELFSTGLFRDLLLGFFAGLDVFFLIGEAQKKYSAKQGSLATLGIKTEKPTPAIPA
jgi:hypothetical protein